MEMKTDFSPWGDVETDWLVVGIAESDRPSEGVADLDERLGGQLTRLHDAGDFSGKPADRLAVHDVPGIAAGRLLLVGLGNQDELTVARLRKAMQAAARTVSAKKDVSVAVAVADAGPLSAEDCARIVTIAFGVGCVGQDSYRAEPQHFLLKRISVLTHSGGDESEVTEEVRRGRIIAGAINLTRELVNRPAAEIYPESFAARAESLAGECGLACEVLDESRLQTEKMEALLAVAVGSDRPPRVVVLQHGGEADGPTLVLVGKGVTFDSGGLSIKSSEGMTTMKCDMAGAATVLGAMTAIARLKLPVKVRAYMGLVENMVSGSSYKLGDVLTAHNGTTIEVLNTDAEGRLVLADVLSYAVDQGADKLIDLATLTGACVVALGEEVTGAFSNDDDWCASVLAAAETCGEDAWQMPMLELYDELIKSDVADIKNIGGRWGGASTAAKFLERFVGKTPWVHLDIAGPSFASSNQAHREGGATGCMVATLVEVAEQFSGK
jgi:leucyl aminopeptidase